jgi:hypothetical protein
MPARNIECHIEDAAHPLEADQEVVDLLDQNTRLTGKVAQLEYQASWAATEERARIAAWLRTFTGSERLNDAANRIETGEHLK